MAKYKSNDGLEWNNKVEADLQNKKLQNKCKRCDGEGKCYVTVTNAKWIRTEYFPDHLEKRWRTCPICKGDGYY